MKDNPLITVIIPCHNNENTLERAVVSIINQTYRPLEIIIVDDFSTDSSFDIAKSLSKKNDNVFAYKSNYDDKNRIGKNGRNINAGYSARNFGLEKSSGEWITFQDADDFSLLNRIEIEYMLATKYKSNHVLVDWFGEDPNLLNKSFDINSFLQENDPMNFIIDKKTIYKLSKKTKGYGAIAFQKLYSKIPFEFKTKRVINRFFYGSFDNFPGTGNSPLFKREVLKNIKFRKLQQRTWPSFVGRGADRDFNFNIAYTYKNSYSFKIPLYVWINGSQNEKYIKYKKYVK